ncbi:MAG: M23 family metallopeptidase [Candidatus Promineifilaceae bacterium]|nr:M23 family metallopeptidase [Candidatus Promineifilaceae bacterium]
MLTPTADSPKATVSPQPTFTVPSSPPASDQDHYWFGRPVPQGSTVWTDKSYPYGSTKGDTLRPHHGVEFNVPRGTTVLAVADGTVRVAGSDTTVATGPAPAFYGNVVVIEHDFTVEGKAIYTLYGHLAEVLVQTGQSVEANEVIGLSGASGVADGPHLHFEVRVGQNSYGATRNPLLWLYPFPERGVVAGRVTWPDGSLASQVPLQLRRLDAPSAYAATTTYAAGNLNSDDRWQENFAFDDVEAGFYELTVGAGQAIQKFELWVYPYQTNFIEVDLQG